MSGSASAERARGFLWVTIAYLAAGVVALLAGIALRGEAPLVLVAGADLAATLVIFAFSRAFGNSSFYDAYWSVAPVPIALYLTLGPGLGEALPARQGLVVLLVALWAVRLTHNWARGWSGLAHEDWRYVDLKARRGVAAFALDLFGIHLFPTVAVYLGCLPLLAALATGGAPLGPLDAVAAVVTLSGVALELFADNQLRRFRATAAPGAICTRGLWAWSRHPNYLGELLFWWGLLLFGLASGGFRPWMAAGALVMTALFHFASLPLLENRMAARRPGWEAHCRRVPRLVPRPFRRGPAAEDPAGP